MSKILNIPIDEIKPRVKSQREKPQGVSELASSIRRNGLLNPIIVAEDYTLIAGGCRLAAYELINFQGHEGFEKIPARIFSDLSKKQRQIIELEENTKRTDLTWQEKVLAYYELNKIYIEEDGLSPQETADQLGLTKQHLQLQLRIAKELLEGNPSIGSADSLIQAKNIFEREERRKIDNATNELSEFIIGESREVGRDVEHLPQTDMVNVTEEGAEYTMSRVTLPSRPEKDIEQGDFIKFAQSYSGKKFNLLHCDFPYGISHGNSAQGGADQWGAYEDTPETYWQLLQALASGIDNILYPSAHIIFWLSMRYYNETVQFFNENFDNIKVDYQPLVWHKTDNKGVIRDLKHTPRNITETALLITRGDREILTPIANCYGAPTQKADAVHISEKPEPMLRHFLRLCVNNYSEVLDPTCGSGTSLRAAESLGANRVKGLDLNQEYADTAWAKLKSARALADASKKIGED